MGILKTSEADCADAKRVHDDNIASSSDLETLHGDLTRVLQTATAIGDKVGEVETKKASLRTFAPNSDGKSLREVEKEVSALLAEKEAKNKHNSDLNKENAAIGRAQQIVTTRAAGAEKAAADKQAQYNSFGSNDKARSDIREEIAKCNTQEAQLREQEAPLRQEIGKAEAVSAARAKRAQRRASGSTNERERSQRKEEPAAAPTSASEASAKTSERQHQQNPSFVRAERAGVAGERANNLLLLRQQPSSLALASVRSLRSPPPSSSSPLTPPTPQEKGRLREAAAAEERELSGRVSAFSASLGEISSHNGQISSFNPASKAKELAALEATIQKIENEIASNAAVIAEMEPQIAEMRGRAGDRERQKKVRGRGGVKSLLLLLLLRPCP
jgi:septal ring factor EnvC (AmiA/AmiB activator)